MSIDSNQYTQGRTKMTNDKKIHPFEKTLGPGPYRFVGFANIPVHIMEANPSAFANAMANLPRVERGMGTCAHCNMAILNVFIVQCGDGKRYGVGSDCILKVSQEPKLISDVKKEIAKMNKTKRQENKDRHHNEIEAYLNENKEKLSKKPHPNQFLAEQGKTYFDYLQFKFYACGAAGLKRFHAELFKKGDKK
jgi:hypothetical protein